jgi:hypothetical protein
MWVANHVSNDIRLFPVLGSFRGVRNRKPGREEIFMTKYDKGSLKIYDLSLSGNGK